MVVVRAMQAVSLTMKLLRQLPLRSHSVPQQPSATGPGTEPGCTQWTVASRHLVTAAGSLASYSRTVGSASQPAATPR